MKQVFAFIACAAVCFSLTISAWSQTSSTAATTTTKPKWNAQDHYSKRKAEIERAVDAIPGETSATVVLLGDSITEGFKIVTELGGMAVVNEGIGGDQVDRPTTSSGVINRLNLVKEAKPAVVFVMIGVNDFWGGKEELDDVLGQYKKMAPALRAAVPSAKIVIQSVLPAGGKHAHLNAKINGLNAQLPAIATSIQADYLDIGSKMADPRGELKTEFTTDGIHLTAPAYELWKTELETKMKDL